MKRLKLQRLCSGSGQITDQGARLVDIALDNGNAFNGDGWKYISSAFAKNTVHFIGLLSDGGVHSRYDQLAAFLKGAKKSGAKSIRVHILTVKPRTCVGDPARIEANPAVLCLHTNNGSANHDTQNISIYIIYIHSSSYSAIGDVSAPHVEGIVG